ncbi:hypothetical protein [Psychroserpens sp. SPM9]|uniref:hypothetical protein n=1 Tax=Psychroserpens sp. SPM9 TaxID=2975598 RepID=UPI0021A7C293|nr:hypothetical protein [Psychroserpens sp. SPM9]MDG5492526.1 hypothetical protein [Psychroserpens sp. SPM9]
MKTQTFKLFTVLALMLSMSCSVDNLNEDYENEIFEKAIDLEVQKDSKSDKNEYNQQRMGNPAPTYNPNLTELYPIPNGTHVVGMYIDMDFIESGYPNPYTGSFNLHFRNEMLTHFTIYSIETAASDDCGNIELWIINVEEYNDYMITQGGTLIENDIHTGGGNTSNTNSATLGNVDKDKKDPNNPDPNDTDNPNDPVETDPDLEPEMVIERFYISPFGLISLVEGCFESEIID